MPLSHYLAKSRDGLATVFKAHGESSQSTDEGNLLLSYIGVPLARLERALKIVSKRRDDATHEGELEIQKQFGDIRKTFQGRKDKESLRDLNKWQAKLMDAISQEKPEFWGLTEESNRKKLADLIRENWQPGGSYEAEHSLLEKPKVVLSSLESPIKVRRDQLNARLYPLLHGLEGESEREEVEKWTKSIKSELKKIYGDRMYCENVIWDSVYFIINRFEGRVDLLESDGHIPPVLDIENVLDAIRLGVSLGEKK